MVKDNEDLANTIVNVPTLPHVINFLSSNFTDIKVQVHYTGKCCIMPTQFHISKTKNQKKTIIIGHYDTMLKS